MLLASDALTIADKLVDFRPYIMLDVDNISEQVYEAAKRGKYEINHDVFYEDKIFVELLAEEIESYGYRVEIAERIHEDKLFYTVRVSWYDEHSLM